MQTDLPLHLITTPAAAEALAQLVKRADSTLTRTPIPRASGQ